MEKKNKSMLYMYFLIVSGFIMVQGCSQSTTGEEEALVWTTGEENASSDNGTNSDSEDQNNQEETDSETDTEGSDSFLLPEVDLRNWKVTLPVGNNGKPTEV
ncbi:MAG: hypothetical protein AAFY00_12585, partial [Bacteroidota bacterium]